MITKFTIFRLIILNTNRGFLVLMLLFMALSESLTQDYVLSQREKVYTIADGLPSNEVHYVYEDDKNYLWFCTDEGLSRFDGRNFKNYTQKDGLPEAFVLKLKRLNSGRTIGWTLHASLFYFEQGKIIPFSVNEFLCDRLDKCIITDIVDDHNGNLFISTSDRNGYLVIDPDGNVEFFKKGDDHNGTIYNAMKVDSEWFSYFERFDELQLTSVLIPDQDTLKNMSLGQHGESRPLKFDQTHYQIIGDKLIVTDSLSTFIVDLPESCWSLRRRGDKILLFSYYYGYFEYAIGKKQLTDKVKKYSQYSLTNYFKDSRGIEWFTTHSSGIIRKSPNQVVELTSDFLEGNYIHKARKSSQGTSYIMVDKNEFKRVSLWKLDPDFKATEIDKVVEPKILFQSVDGGGNVIYFGFTNIEGNRYVLKTYGDRTDIIKIFLKCINKFFNAIDKVSLVHKVYFRDSCLYVLNENTLAYYCYDDAKDRQLELDRSLDIRTISANSKYIFLGSKNNGLLYVDINTLEVFKIDQELPSNHVKSITIQSDDTLYISTIGGIHRLVFDNNSYNFKGYLNSNVGLPIEEINDIDYFNDSLLVTYPNGIFYIPVESFNEIDRLSTDPFISSVDHSRKSKDNEALILEHKDNYIRFQFAMLYFGNPLKEEIWYRLKGHKDEWSLSEARTLEYISLPPDRYSLELATKNGDEFLVHDRFGFKIETPFHLSSWMYLIYALTTILIFGIAIFLIRRYDKMKQERIFSLKSLRLKVLMSQLNPHFIFNVLNGIQSLIVDNKTVKASDKLADFSRLLRNTLDASDRSLITIKEDMELIKEYSDFEIQRKNGAVDISYRIDSSVESYFTPPMLIQPLIENSIRHGFKNSGRKNGKIDIEITNHHDYIYYSIKDNGKGVDNKLKMESGKGIQLVQERVKILNDKNNVDDNFTIVSQPDGTKITFNLAQISKPWN